jgi:hypothetical protein
MVGAAAMAAAAPAAAAPRELDSILTTTGSVSVTWHGDRSRGCAQAGVCGYGGSLSMHPPTDGALFLVVTGSRLRSGFGELDPFDMPVVVRVGRRDPGTAPDACVDSVPLSLIEVSVRRPRASRVRVGLAGGGLAPGRCAGPDLSGILSRLPRGTVPAARLRRGGVTIDLSGRRRYASGRFSGTVISTLRVHVGAAQGTRSLVEPPSGGGGGGRRGRLVRVGDLHAVYRVTGFAGQVATTFHALPEPLCTAIDACGASGSANWAILSSGGTVVVDAEAEVGRSARGLRGVLAGVRRGRHAFVATQPNLRHQTGTTTVRLTRPGAATCHDTTFTPAPDLGSSEAPALQVFLGAPQDVNLEATDFMRAGCPGPSEGGVFGRQPVAGGSLPLAALARRGVELPLRGGGGFDDGGYAGAWRSRFKLELKRVEERVSYRFVRVRR